MVDIGSRQYYLSKATYWLLLIVAITIAVVSFISNLSFENRFIMTGVLLGVGINVLLYLNRFEVKRITLDEDTIEITYYEQMYFGKPRQSFPKREINVLNGDNILVLSNGKVVIAKIRRKALDSQDWVILKDYFEVSFAD